MRHKDPSRRESAPCVRRTRRAPQSRLPALLQTGSVRPPAVCAPDVPAPPSRGRRRRRCAAEKLPPLRSGIRGSWDCSCRSAARELPPCARTASPETRASRSPPGNRPAVGTPAGRGTCGPPIGPPRGAPPACARRSGPPGLPALSVPRAGRNRNRPVASSLHCSGNRSSCSSSAHSSGRYSIAPAASP